MTEGAPGMMTLLEDMVRLPMTVILFAAREMVETMERWAPGVEPTASRMALSAAGRVPAVGGVEKYRVVPERDWATETGSAAASAPPAKDDKENRNMADTNLNDEDIKLIQYAIVSVERRKEKVLQQPQYHLEKGRTSSDSFKSARLAKFVDKHPEEVADRDLDQVEVYLEVLARWPKRDLKYEEKSLDMEEEKLDYLRRLANA